LAITTISGFAAKPGAKAFALSPPKMKTAWAINACINGGFYAAKRSKSRPVEGRRPGTHLMHWLAGGNDEDQSLANNSTACSAALAPTYADAL
jgi:hypothetical protein